LLYRSPHPAHTPYPGWQSPYVDLFRHFAVGKWEKSAKQGEVSEVMVSAAGSFGHGDAVTLYVTAGRRLLTRPSTRAILHSSICLFCYVQDKTLRTKVFRISGAVPASNFIQLPKASSHSLGLVGHYLYLEFRVIPERYFVVHLDVATVGRLLGLVPVLCATIPHTSACGLAAAPCYCLTDGHTCRTLRTSCFGGGASALQCCEACSRLPFGCKLHTRALVPSTHRLVDWWYVCHFPTSSRSSKLLPHGCSSLS